MAEEIKITEINKITIAPNEYLVIKLPENISLDSLHRARKSIQRMFNEEEMKRILVVNEVIKFEKVEIEKEIDPG